MQVILAVVGIVLALWLGYMVIALGGELVILSIDAAARGSFASSPALAWVLVGVVLGAVIGGLYGLRRVGAPASKRLAATLIVVPFGTMFMIGWVRGVPHGYDPPTPATTGAETGVTLRRNNINLRSGPSPNSRVLQTLPEGSRVIPLRTSTTGEWTEVADASNPPVFRGWIKSSYLASVGGLAVPQPSGPEIPLDSIGSKPQVGKLSGVPASPPRPREPRTRGFIAAVDPAGDVFPSATPGGFDWRGTPRFLGSDYPAPDIISASGSLDDDTLTIEVRFSRGTFDPRRTEAGISLDVDGDASTGDRQANIPSGVDYSLDVAAAAFKAHATLNLFSATGNFVRRDVVGFATTVLVDGYSVRIPLNAIGAGDGSRLRFFVVTNILLDERSSTVILDALPGGVLPTGWLVPRR